MKNVLSSYLKLFISVYLIFTISLQNILSIPLLSTIDDSDTATAQLVLPNDLVITKTYSGEVYPGAQIEAIIDYTNNGDSELSGIKINDIYSNWLSYDSIVYSNPNVLSSPISFLHDSNFKTLYFDHITLPWNSNGQIIVKYIVSPSLPENIDVTNTWTISIWCVLCQDPYTVSDDWLSVWFVNPRPIVPPPPYDLQIISTISWSDTYMSWEYIDVIVDLSNDTYSGSDIILQLDYKTYLLDFVGVLSSWDVDLPDYSIYRPNNNIYNIPYSYNNSDIAKVTRDWFDLTPWTSQIVLRFRSINDYTTPIDINFNLGIPNEYNQITTIWETNPSNNTDGVSVQWPDFDLWTNIYILTWDESISSPGAYNASWTIVYRMEFGNNWPARDNVFLNFGYNGINNNDVISYTWNRDYWVMQTWNNGDMYIPEWYSLFWTGVSLASWESGYIDIVTKIHQCWNSHAQSSISILDNYNTVLATDPWYSRADRYILNRARETDTNNNRDYVDILSDWYCEPWVPRYYDNVISSISTWASWSITPWQVITFWIPFNTYSSQNYWWYSIGIWVQYSSWMKFLWLVTTGMGGNVWIIDNLSDNITSMKNNIIKNQYNNTQDDIEFIYNNPWLFVTGQCGFATYPSWTPTDNPLPLWPYMNSVSWELSNQYITQYEYYQSIWYDDIYSHALALIDTQTYIYNFSHQPSTDQVMEDFREWYYPCIYNMVYLQGIDSWMTTWQAANQAQIFATQTTDSLITKPSMFGVCNSNLGIFTDYNICNKNYDILSLFYDNSQYLNNVFEDKLEETLTNAYAAWLSTSQFRQLLTNNIFGLYSYNRPIVRQYSMIYSWYNWVEFCPDTICIDNYASDTNPSPAQYIDLWYSEYTQIMTAYDDSFYSWLWIPWNGWYIETRSLVNMWSDIFIDDFSQSGKLQISNLSSVIFESMKLWLSFVVNEVSPWTIIDLLAKIWNLRSCDPSAGARDYNYNCLTDISFSFNNDVYDPLWWHSGDIIQWDDNQTWTSIIVWYREPYDLNITKTIDAVSGSLPWDIVTVTTSICNSWSSRSDITVTENYTPGLTYLYAILTGTDIWVSYTIDPAWSRIVRSNVSLDSWECKTVITQYRLLDTLLPLSILDFSSHAWSVAAWSSSTGSAHAEVSWFVIAPEPNIYLPYGDKQILYSTFYTWDEIVYRITYSNPGSITWVMTLNDVYWSGIEFSWVVSSTQLLPSYYHDISSRTITRSDIIVPPFSNHSIDLSFIISENNLPFNTINNNFSYSMLFTPQNSITDVNKSNNISSWKWSYSLNRFEWVVLEDINDDDLPDGLDMPMSWVIVSISQSGILIWTTTTSSTWFYLFTWLLPGVYTFSYTTPYWYTAIWSFVWTISNGNLSTEDSSIIANYPSYSSSSTGNITLMAIQEDPEDPICWNAVIETWENCDDWANNWLAWYCSTDCNTIIPESTCGDWNLDDGEQCDDGNNTNWDACSAICQFETPSCNISLSSYLSNNPLIVSFALTGFWFGSMQILQTINYGDGNMDLYPTGLNFTHQYVGMWPYTIVATVANSLNNDIYATCNLNVQWSVTRWWGSSSWGWVNPYCWDGIVNNNEQCDDGNNINDDLCTSTCTSNSNQSCSGDNCNNLTWENNHIPTIIEDIVDIFVNTEDIKTNIIKIIPRTWAY